MTSKPVLVVGAGPTGLFLALWLARLGTPVRIIDRDDGPGETSRAMVVHARTLEFYRQLGFADEIVRRGLKVQRLGIRDAGRLEGAVEIGDLGVGLSPFPFMLSFPQDEHEAALIEQLGMAGVSVERRTALTGFETEADGVRATLAGPHGPETVAASYIAGCDGARSTVRQVVGIGLPGGTYARRFFVADAAIEGEAAGDSMGLCLTGHDFCLVVPLRRPGRARLIGIVPDEVDQDHATFEDVRPSVSRNTGLVVSDVEWFSTYRVHHRVSERFRAGRAFLLGDAAHLHSPVGGQGMNTGLGDATNLAWKLAAVLAGRADAGLLDSYEPERLAFAQHLVSTTDRAFQLVTDRGLLGQGWRKIVMAHVVPLAFKLPLVPRHAFRLVSQIDIEYRNSPASHGTAGHVHGGDRLPWVPDAGRDNFLPLTALDWQVHVYGTASAEVTAAASAHGLALHVMPWTDDAKAKGLQRDASYLVRPDGHVAVAAPHGRAELDSYVARWALRPRQAAA